MDQDKNKSPGINPQLQSFITKSKVLNEKNKTNQSKTAAVLIGKTRVGKSTLFHILKGDELDINEKGKLFSNKVNCFIGLDGNSTTKTPNIYHYQFKNQDAQDENIDIIDTPGFDDNSDKLDDTIQQIHLSKILNSYSKVILIVLIKFDDNDHASYRRPLQYAQDLLKEQQDVNSIFENFGICLIVNYIEQNQLEDFQEQITNDIQEKENNSNKGTEFQKYKLAQDFLIKIKENIFILEPKPIKQQQEQLKIQIYNFISKNRVNYKKVSFKLSLTDNGKYIIQNMLENFRQICESEISNSIRIFFEETQKLTDLIYKKYLLMDFSQIIKDEFSLEYVKDLYFKYFKQIFQNQIYDQCQSTISFKGIKKKVWNEIKVIQTQILSQIKLNETEELIINAVETYIKTFQNFQNWNRLLLFLGNPQSGKSSAINFLYKTKLIKQQSHLPFIMKTHYEEIKNENIIEVGSMEKDQIIEFQDFSQDYIQLLQFFIFLSQKNEKKDNSQMKKYSSAQKHFQSQMIYNKMILSITQI